MTVSALILSKKALAAMTTHHHEEACVENNLDRNPVDDPPEQIQHARCKRRGPQSDG